MGVGGLQSALTPYDRNRAMPGRRDLNWLVEGRKAPHPGVILPRSASRAAGIFLTAAGERRYPPFSL